MILKLWPWWPRKRPLNLSRLKIRSVDFKLHFWNQCIPLIKMSYRLSYWENFHFSNFQHPASEAANKVFFQVFLRYLLSLRHRGFLSVLFRQGRRMLVRLLLWKCVWHREARLRDRRVGFWRCGCCPHIGTRKFPGIMPCHSMGHLKGKF